MFCVTSIDHENVYVICLLGLGLLGDIDQVDPFVKSYIDSWRAVQATWKTVSGDTCS